MNKEEDIGINALVVDDNEVNMFALVSMLGLFKISADQASSGKNAIKMAESKEYELIFIDHIMPEMDGVKTTEILRIISGDTNKPAIFALTSLVTPEIKASYRKAGANDVYAKPLGLIELFNILKLSFPHLSTVTLNSMKDTSFSLTEQDFIKSVLSEINEINYQIGLKYSTGNPILYIHLLDAGLKDVQTCINLITEGRNKETLEGLRIGVHNLKSVFVNIGALELLEDAKIIEASISDGDANNMDLLLSYFINQVESLKAKLILALQKVHSIIPLISQKREKNHILMTEQEYEQSLSDAIYYIKRYEYISIISETEKLILTGHQEFRSEFIKMLEDIKEFNYNQAMDRILKIKMKL